MKIALTTDEYNKTGGISRYVYELSNHFKKEHDVTVFAAKWGWESDVKFKYVWGGFGPRVCRNIPFALQNTIRLKLGGFDIVHTNGCDSIGADVITAHSIHKAGMKAGMDRGLGVLDKFCLTVEKANYTGRRYKKVICVSESSKKELMECYGVPDEDIVVIYNGVDLEEFKPERNWELRESYGVGDDEILLMIVATEFYRKGVTELIEAMRRLDRNIKLMIVGRASPEGLRSYDGIYRETILKYGLKKRIIFTGKVHNLNKYYNIADIFVFPTKYEAFGLPILEAMACGVPVIASKIGAGELINGKNGIHFDNPYSIDNIVEKIEILISKNELRRKMGADGRKTAIEYGWDNVAEKTMDIYRKYCL